MGRGAPCASHRRAGRPQPPPWDRPPRPSFSGPERPPQEARQMDGAAEGTPPPHTRHSTACVSSEPLLTFQPRRDARSHGSANFTRWQLRVLTLPFLETLAAQREPVPRSVSVESPGRCCPQVFGVPRSTGQEGAAGPFRARCADVQQSQTSQVSRTNGQGHPSRQGALAETGLGPGPSGSEGRGHCCWDSGWDMGPSGWQVPGGQEVIGLSGGGCWSCSCGS